jgi:hypothetical protein
MKVLLFTLVRAFEFSLSIPVKDVLIKNRGLILRPIVNADGKDLESLPLFIKAVKGN